jgi:hypothetical protein
LLAKRNFDVIKMHGTAIKRNTAVGMTTRLGLDDFCISTFQDQLWGQSSLPFSGKWGLIPWRQSDRGVRLTTH